jgi:hypothetical protein
VSITDRTRPLVAVVFRVPLFVEALAAAFDGLAEVQGVRAGDGALAGLVHALRPDAIVIESPGEPELRVAVPTLHVDLEAASVRQLVVGEWVELDVELSGEDIRNAVLNELVSGATA